VNAACLAADGDGWHYWCWTDDWQSSLAHRREQKADPVATYFQGESMGLYDEDGDPRPVVPLVCNYSAELKRRVATCTAPKKSEVLLLSSATKMYTLFRRMSTPTAAAVNGALARLGVEADYLWTSQNDVRITQDTLDSYKLIVIADSMYGRDYPELPEMLLRFVENGGTLYFAMDQFDAIEDEYGVRHASPALARLCGVDPDGYTDWPGANQPCRNWPFQTDVAHEPNFDASAYSRLYWGICPEFRHRAAVPYRQQLLSFRTSDDDRFTPVPGLAHGAEVIAVGKSARSTMPFVYRHQLGNGTVYVNAWTNNVFRDSATRHDYGGWDYDFILALPIETANITNVDITRGASIWLRNSWGYFWNEK
jgi:hypothetical protein